MESRSRTGNDKWEMTNEKWKIPLFRIDTLISSPNDKRDWQECPLSRAVLDRQEGLPYSTNMPNPNHESLTAIAHRVRPSGRLWNPAADVYRSKDGWMVKVDLAGICADDLEIEIDQSSLRVRGCRRDTFYKQGYSYQQMEITYSRFEKTIPFPCLIETASLSHDYLDGFLIVHLRCS